MNRGVRAVGSKLGVADSVADLCAGGSAAGVEFGLTAAAAVRIPSAPLCLPLTLVCGFQLQRVACFLRLGVICSGCVTDGLLMWVWE